jgi:hypothetical protein
MMPFCMLAGEVLEFDDQHMIIRKGNPNPDRVLARGVHEGGLYRLLVGYR